MYCVKHQDKSTTTKIKAPTTMYCVKLFSVTPRSPRGFLSRMSDHYCEATLDIFPSVSQCFCPPPFLLGATLTVEPPSIYSRIGSRIPNLLLLFRKRDGHREEYPKLLSGAKK